MNSKQRAPGASPPLGSNGGDRGALGPTQKRALPHHRETDRAYPVNADTH